MKMTTYDTKYIEIKKRDIDGEYCNCKSNYVMSQVMKNISLTSYTIETMGMQA